MQTMLELLAKLAHPQDVLEFCRQAFGRYGRGILVLENTPTSVKLQVWHPRTVFNIVARSGNTEGGYLGCISSARTLGVGEDWHRGSDLPDGRICGNVMLEIMAAIISYDAENVDVETEARAAKRYANLSPAKSTGLERGYIIGMDPASDDVSSMVVMPPATEPPSAPDIFVFFVEGRSISDFTRYDNALVLHDKMLGDITYPIGFPELIEYKIVNKDKNHVSSDTVKNILAMLPRA